MPLKNASNVVLLDGNGVLDGYIRYEVTAAHSPHHQVFWMVEGGEIAFFGGDDAPQLQQMRTRYIAKYDYDGKKCMQLRQEWWQKGREEGWEFLFYHDIRTPVYKFWNFEILKLGNFLYARLLIEIKVVLIADNVSFFRELNFGDYKLAENIWVHNFPIEQFPIKKKACSGQSRPLLTYEKHQV